LSDERPPNSQAYTDDLTRTVTRPLAKPLIELVSKRLVSADLLEHDRRPVLREIVVRQIKRNGDAPDQFAAWRLVVRLSEHARQMRRVQVGALSQLPET